jgi:hypothetical protein
MPIRRICALKVGAAKLLMDNATTLSQIAEVA